jgi:hypothetical protein
MNFNIIGLPEGEAFELKNQSFQEIEIKLKHKSTNFVNCNLGQTNIFVRPDTKTIVFYNCSIVNCSIESKDSKQKTNIHVIIGGNSRIDTLSFVNINLHLTSDSVDINPIYTFRNCVVYTEVSNEMYERIFEYRICDSLFSFSGGGGQYCEGVWYTIRVPGSYLKQSY